MNRDEQIKYIEKSMERFLGSVAGFTPSLVVSMLIHGAIGLYTMIETSDVPGRHSEEHFVEVVRIAYKLHNDKMKKSMVH